MTRASPSYRPLFRKYAAYCAGLVTVALLASGALSLYSGYQELRALLDEVQREKARGAAFRIEQFARVIEAQLRGALLVEAAGIEQSAEERHLELIRVMRQAPAISDLAWVDAAGVQQVKVSRTVRDKIGPPAGSDAELLAHPAVLGARTGKLHVGPVTLRSESEPYSMFAIAGQGSNDQRGLREGSALLADVNLKLVWDIVSAIQVGATGNAHVVDGAGRLISHPDISLVLRNTDLSQRPQVRAALDARDASAGNLTISRVAADGAARSVLTAWAPIPALGWHAFVELPLSEAFAPLYDAAIRTGVLIALGIGLAVLAALALARRMTAPILALERGVTRIGAGHLEARVQIDTGDELQSLADQFNRMTGQLRDSYEGLEAKIAERTHQLAAANQAKSRFLAAASHDLRQPVHALGLFLAQMREARDPEERERLLRNVEASSRSVLQLLEALFDVSKLDAGRVEVEITEFPVQTVLNRLEQNFAIAAQAKGLRLRIRPAPARIVTDPLLLERVLMNLVSNAVRYTSEGGVLVGCRTRGGRLRIEVYDTGIGIPLAAQAHVFDEFYQVERAGSQQMTGVGLGLGLSIVKRLADLLQMPIEMRSVERKGTFFAVHVKTATATRADVSRHAEPAPRGFDGHAVLVIDDDPAARDAIAGLLAQWGMRTISAACGTEALAAISNNDSVIDAIVCDYRLGHDERGTDVIERVRKARGVEVPAVIVSGDTSEAVNQEARRAGVHRLAKPVEAAKLRALLAHLIVDRSATGSEARVADNARQ